jgi:miniconductance mechanosensitive channel
MPQFGADGDVVDIALHTIKVQNWDKTVTTIPTHRLISDSFKNWRSMSESGGRRIKRAVVIDMNSIRFLTDADIKRFGRFALLKDYIADKKRELEEYNNEVAPADSDIIANARKLTNIGTFRMYVVQYLRSHPKIHDKMTFLIRQLSPTAQGLPIEIYVFSNDVNWVAYEGIQSDIFDHLLAIVPEFGLRVFQQPTGHDFQQALTGAAYAETTGLN